MTTDSITADSLATVCDKCGSTEFTDSSTAFGLRVNRYCNNDAPHSMGHYYRAANPTEGQASVEPASAALVPVDTAATPISAADIVAEIKAEHAACITALSNALDRAIRCGELLTQLKPTVNHGEWEKWIGSNLPFSARTARAYMQLFANNDQLQSKRQHSAVLSLREAFLIIAPPKEDPEGVEADPSDSAVIELRTEPKAPTTPTFTGSGLTPRQPQSPGKSNKQQAEPAKAKPGSEKKPAKVNARLLAAFGVIQRAIDKRNLDKQAGHHLDALLRLIEECDGEADEELGEAAA